MDDTLLFLHVLSAFMLMATVVMLSAVALGAPVGTRVLSVGNLLWDVGGLGTLGFGLWIVVREDLYGIGDGWIVAAIALWFVATGLGVRARDEIEPAAAAEAPAFTSRGVVVHWLRALLVVGFLVLMIWKPGA